MGTDRLIRFVKPPSPEAVFELLEDYLGALMLDLQKEGRDGRFATVLLPGPKSRAYRRQIGPTEGQRLYWAEESANGEPRLIEVVVLEDNVDVVTRSADELTMDIAAGFARRCAQIFGGKQEP